MEVLDGPFGFHGVEKAGGHKHPGVIHPFFTGPGENKVANKFLRSVSNEFGGFYNPPGKNVTETFPE
jgi:hypothetical protein